MTNQTVSIGKTGKTFAVDTAKLSADVLAYLVGFACKQVLNNAFTSAYAAAKEDNQPEGKRVEAGLANVQKRLDALLSGDIRATRESDPIARRARILAHNAVGRSDAFHAMLAAGGYKASSKEALDWLKAKVDANVDKFRAQAEKQLAEESSLELELDL